MICGECRIRTYGPPKRPSVFKTDAIDHSANSPKKMKLILNSLTTIGLVLTYKECCFYRIHYSQNIRYPLLCRSFLVFPNIGVYSTLLSVFVSLEYLSSMLQVGIEPTKLNIVVPNSNNSFIHSHTLGINHCVGPLHHYSLWDYFYQNQYHISSDI